MPASSAACVTRTRLTIADSPFPDRELATVGAKAGDPQTYELICRLRADALTVHRADKFRSDPMNAHLDELVGGQAAITERGHLVDVLGSNAVDAQGDHLVLVDPSPERGVSPDEIRRDAMNFERDDVIGRQVAKLRT